MLGPVILLCSHQTNSFRYIKISNNYSKSNVNAIKLIKMYIRLLSGSIKVLGTYRSKCFL